MVLPLIVAAVSSFGFGSGSGHAAQPVHAEVGVHDAKIVRLLSIPVEEDGVVLGQIDVIETSGDPLRLIAFREGDAMTAEDGRVHVRRFGPNGKSSPDDLSEGRIGGYGATVVARGTGVCVAVVHAVLADGSFETMEVMQLACEATSGSGD